jgi:hypothetical protein
MRKRFNAGRRSAGRRLKKAQKEGRTIVFIDESGLRQRPHRCRTWAPRGQTPLLQLENVVGDGWSHVAELLLPLVSGHDPQPAGGGVSGTSVAPPYRESC